jgi:hypothetical protein
MCSSSAKLLYCIFRMDFVNSAKRRGMMNIAMEIFISHQYNNYHGNLRVMNNRTFMINFCDIINENVNFNSIFDHIPQVLIFVRLIPERLFPYGIFIWLDYQCI